MAMSALILISTVWAGGASSIWIGRNYILRYKPDVDLVGFGFSTVVHGFFGGVAGLIVGAFIVERIGAVLYKKK
jgi:hypothetical protein